MIVFGSAYLPINQTLADGRKYVRGIVEVTSAIA
jgi:hypothetical protein